MFDLNRIILGLDGRIISYWVLRSTYRALILARRGDVNPCNDRAACCSATMAAKSELIPSNENRFFQGAPPLIGGLVDRRFEPDEPNARREIMAFNVVEKNVIR